MPLFLYDTQVNPLLSEHNCGKEESYNKCFCRFFDAAHLKQSHFAVFPGRITHHSTERRISVHIQLHKFPLSQTNPRYPLRHAHRVVKKGERSVL